MSEKDVIQDNLWVVASKESCCSLSGVSRAQSRQQQSSLPTDYRQHRIWHCSNHFKANFLVLYSAAKDIWYDRMYNFYLKN